MLIIKSSNDKYKNGSRDEKVYKVEAAECTKVILKAGMEHGLISFEYCCIYHIVSGELALKNQKITLSENDCLFVPKLSSEKLICIKDSVLSKISVSTDIPLSFASSTKPCVFPDNPDIYRQIEKLWKLSYFPCTVIGAKEAILISLFNDMENSRHSVPSEIRLYTDACRWIESNSHHAITAQNAADALGISRAHLNRVFKSVSGELLSKKISDYRIIHIKRMCAQRDITIRHIADMLEFGSEELLCKFFRYHTGMALSEYMKKFI